jgi:endonuclease YncB( thermonuclease family)
MLRLRRVAPILALSILLPFLLLAKEPIRTEEGIVTRVIDGNTIHVTTPEDSQLEIRLYGIDAPETEKVNRRTGVVSKPGQPHGAEAEKALTEKVLDKRVKVVVMDIDRYPRMVAIIYLDGRDINREMVKEGHAWAYREDLHGPYVSEYSDAEKEARSQHLGLWANPEPPWEFRNRLRMGQ